MQYIFIDIILFYAQFVLIDVDFSRWVLLCVTWLIHLVILSELNNLS